MNKKSKTEIFFGLLLLIIAFGLGMAFKKSGDQLLITAQTPVVQQGASDAAVVEKTPAAPAYTVPKDTQACYVGGCSGQICSDTPGAISTCEFKDAYSCYKSNITTCEQQSDGQCGWTQTTALQLCLQQNPAQFQ